MRTAFDRAAGHRPLSLPGCRSMVSSWQRQSGGWTADPRERYWLEVSARGDDLGVDLNAPTTNETGGSFWSYDLLREVGDGDVVLHYDR
jgi:hypothetical protein